MYLRRSNTAQRTATSYVTVGVHGLKSDKKDIAEATPVMQGRSRNDAGRQNMRTRQIRCRGTDQKTYRQRRLSSLCLGRMVFCLAAADIKFIAGHTRAKEDVPVDKVRLAEVGLDPDSLHAHQNDTHQVENRAPGDGCRDSPRCCQREPGAGPTGWHTRNGRRRS